MKQLIQFASAIALGLSSLAFTGTAQAGSGFSIFYSSPGHQHRSYPVSPYYHHHHHGSYWNDRSHALPRHHKHVWQDRHHWSERHRDRTHKPWRQQERKHHFGEYPRRYHPGYARPNRG